MRTKEISVTAQPAEHPPLDPIRERILSRSRELGLTLADMSRAAGRNEAYMHQYMFRRSPRVLPEEVREVLGQILEIPEESLRANAPRSLAVPPRSTMRPVLPAPGAPAADVPAFSERDEIDPSRAPDLVARPFALSTTAGVFAVWITESRDRVRAGDLVYVRPSQPPRPGDLVVAIEDKRIVAIGDLVSFGHGAATIESDGSKRRFSTERVRALRVVTIVPG